MAWLRARLRISSANGVIPAPAGAGPSVISGVGLLGGAGRPGSGEAVGEPAADMATSAAAILVRNEPSAVSSRLASRLPAWLLPAGGLALDTSAT